MDYTDPDLLERMKKIQMTFLTPASGLRMSTLILAATLALTNVTLIVGSGAWIVYKNMQIMPCERPKEYITRVEVKTESNGRKEINFPTKGLYAVHSFANFKCSSESRSTFYDNGLIVPEYNFNYTDYTTKFNDSGDHLDALCHQSNLFAFISVRHDLKMTFKVDRLMTLNHDLTLFKIAEYG